MTLLTNTSIGSTGIAAVHAVYCQSYPECSRFIARLYQTRGRTQVLLHITVHSRCHPFANRLKIVYVAVLDRLFRRVFWAHHQVWCAIALRFHWGQGLYTLHRRVHVFTHLVLLLLQGWETTTKKQASGHYCCHESRYKVCKNCTSVHVWLRPM